MIKDDPNSFHTGLYFGRAPSTSQNRSIVIGVIDSSGSMSSCWPKLVEEWNLLVNDNPEDTFTIIFASSAKEIPDKLLKSSDVGGGTHIVSGIELATQKILSLSERFTDFTLIFVSDGADNDNSTIKERIKKLNKLSNVNVNMLCVGVGSGFPTFVAMELREKYHTGMSSIPAVFLINDYNVDFQTNLSEIRRNHLKKLEKVKVDPPVKPYPWTVEAQNEIFETCYYIAMSNEVTINGTKIANTLGSELSKSTMEDIFRAWTQELQLRSLKDNVRNEAKQAVLLMEYLFTTFEEKASGGKIDKTKLTVLERIKIKEQTSGRHLLLELISECKKMRDGSSLNELSASEAAKRLAIGTQQGKYHNKALQMRGLSTDDFNKFKDEFLEKLSQNKINPTTTQEASFILLQTQKEVFCEDTLPQAIKACNAYELIEAFPMIGHTLFIRRSDASMINPFTIQVLSIPRINKVCDTLSLVSQGNEMEISIGNSEEEKFNAVLPLFDTSDNDVKPFLRSKLFHVLMTFNVMRNVDTFFYDAYYGLLANTLVRLIKYQPSEWRDHMIDLVYNTTELVYGGNPMFENSVDMLLKDPRGAMVTEHKTEKHKCEDISKMILNLLVLKRRNKLGEKECSERVIYMLIENTGRTLKEGLTVFEPTSGELVLDDFKPVEFGQDSRFTKKGGNNSKTTDEAKAQNTQNVVDINAVNVNEENKTSTITATQVVDINEMPSDVNAKTEIKNVEEKTDSVFNFDSYEKMAEYIISSKEHLKFDKIRELKKFLKSQFDKFLARIKSENKMNIKICPATFNKKEYRMNFTFFFFMHNFFCPELEDLDPKIYWIAINHAMKYRDSNDRSQNTIDYDYLPVRTKLTVDYFAKEERDRQEKMYDSFEKPIVDNYLTDFKNSMEMIKNFHCSMDLLKSRATFDVSKPIVSVVFFGPKGMGKSSVIGRMMKESKCVDEKIFEYYKTCYKTFYKNRNNEPYEWIGDNNVDERCLGTTRDVNTLMMNLENKMVQIYDTPGKYSLYKKTLSGIYLAEHVFLCLEGDMDKVKSEIEILKNSVYTIKNKKFKTLNILVTKMDLYKNEKVADEIYHYIHETIDGMHFPTKIDINVLPVSSFNGLNIEKLLALLNSLEPVNTSEKKDAKLLVLNAIGNFGMDKIVYAQVLDGPVTPGAKIQSFPSTKVSTIESIQANYQEVKEYVLPGTVVSLGFKDTHNALRIKHGSVLHVKNVTESLVEKEPVEVKELKIEGCYTGKEELKINSYLKIEFNYFREVFQIKKILNKEGQEVPTLPLKEHVKLELVPTTKVYFEQLWENQDSIIFRGQHHQAVGYAKIAKDGIVYK